MLMNNREFKTRRKNSQCNFKVIFAPAVSVIIFVLVVSFSSSSPSPRQNPLPGLNVTRHTGGSDKITLPSKADAADNCSDNVQSAASFNFDHLIDDYHKSVQSAESASEKTFIVTAYCPCHICCDKFADGVTASGHVIQDGDRFVAAPRDIKFNTRLLIPGYARDTPVKCLDRGGAITAGRLDVFFPTHAEAMEWGVKRLKVKIVK